MMPSCVRSPARNISATASMMPEPQMPVTPILPVAAAKPSSSDQRSQPITLKRGSSVVPVDPHPLDRARRRPLAAGDLRALEGRAGRRRAGQQPVAVAEHDLGIGADVDHQRHLVLQHAAPRRAARRRCRHRRGRRCRAARRPGRRRGPASGRARCRRARCALSVASANGAPPSSVGSMPSSRWCMIGLPTKVSSRMSPGIDHRPRRPPAPMRSSSACRGRRRSSRPRRPGSS